MVLPEKIQELRAVVNFWKSRVDETRHQLQKLLARQVAQPADDRCGQSIMVTLVAMKSRELADSQRGLRRAQANLGRSLELTVAVSPTVKAPAADALSSPLVVLPIGGMKSLGDHRHSA